MDDAINVIFRMNFQTGRASVPPNRLLYACELALFTQDPIRFPHVAQQFALGLSFCASGSFDRSRNSRRQRKGHHLCDASHDNLTPYNLV